MSQGTFQTPMQAYCGKNHSRSGVRLGHMLHMCKTVTRLSPSQTEQTILPLEAQEPAKRACRLRNSQHFDHQAYCSCCLSSPRQQPGPVLQEDSPAFRVTPWQQTYGVDARNK